MCGIFGAVEWQRLETQRVLRATDQLRHRGPDASRFLFDNVAAATVPGRACEFLPERAGVPWQLGFGHRRLSILDLATGGQPMSDATGSWWIIFNGEIYNHADLRARLAAEGATFRTDHSDTETLLLGFAKWGPAVLPQLNGMFAAAIYHRDTGQLWLIRDRFGKKPIYLHHQNGRLVFASELKAIVDYLGAAPALDHLALADFITGCYIHAPRSIFSGIVKVPTAAILEFDLKAPGGRLVSEARYWKIAPPAQSDEVRPADDWKAELAHLLDDAVRIRLLADVPLGAFLSGGLDSATVCALASAHVREPLRAFTIGSDDPAHDETAEAAEVAGILGLRHVTEKCRLDPATLLPEMATVFDEPFSDLSMIPTHQVARLAAREVKVVLTGDGADEFFAGYGIFQSMTERGQLEQIPGLDHVARAVGQRLPIGAPGGGFLARHFRGRGLARYRHQVEEPALLRLLAPGLAPDAAALWPELAELWETSAKFDALGRVSFLQGSTYLSDDILVKVDRATMAHSLEARSPFLDYRVAELALRLPARLKLAGGTGKKILRDLARRWFSAAHLAKPKRGFTVPLKQWMDGALADDLDDLKNCDLLARAQVMRLVAMQRRGQRDYSSLLWRLIILNRWSRQWRTPFCKS